MEGAKALLKGVALGCFKQGEDALATIKPSRDGRATFHTSLLHLSNLPTPKYLIDVKSSPAIE